MPHTPLMAHIATDSLETLQRPSQAGRTVRRIAILSLFCVAALAADAAAQIERHPTGVNVNASGATTVFITYGNLQGMVPVEALWCGELVPAAPDVGSRCDPATVFGRLPLRYDLSRFSGVDGYSDIMSIPPSVARRAYQAAQQGASSEFFYVRRFVDPEGSRPDEFVSVTCRMAGGGARVPFALLDVRLAFETETPVLHLVAGATPPPVSARITYNGTGRLVGRWEIVLPGEEPPSPDDLLTEATLPAELRGTQRRYTELERFNVFLPPTGEFVLDGPDPAGLPTAANGLYMLLLRIEASDEREGDTDLEAAGAGRGLVHTGAVAGFPIPPLRYYIGGGPTDGATAGPLRLLSPTEDALLSAAELPSFSWTPAAAAALYRLEIEDHTGDRVLSALLEPGIEAYRPPPWLTGRLSGDRFRWRVLALDLRGDLLTSSPWRAVRIDLQTGDAPPERP